MWRRASMIHAHSTQDKTIVLALMNRNILKCAHRLISLLLLQSGTSDAVLEALSDQTRLQEARRG